MGFSKMAESVFKRSGTPAATFKSGRSKVRLSAQRKCVISNAMRFDAAKKLSYHDNVGGTVSLVGNSGGLFDVQVDPYY